MGNQPEKTNALQKIYRLRIVIPRYPAFNIYSRIARKTTALGPVCIASIVNKMPGWEVEVIDENNYRHYGPKNQEGLPDHEVLQSMRPADIVGFYGGLSSTIPRIFLLAGQYRQMGIKTIAGGLHFVNETIEEALNNNLDLLLLGEADDTIQEVLPVLISNGDLRQIAGLAFLENGQIHRTAARPPP